MLNRLLYQQQQEGPEYSHESGQHRAAPSKRTKKKSDPNKSIRRSNSGNGVPNQLPSLHRQHHQPEGSPRLDPHLQQAGHYNHMDLAEKRLEELQKLASTTATIKSFVQQQQQLGGSAYQGPNSAGQAVGLGLPASRLPLGSAAAAAVAQMARPGTFMDSAPHTASASRQAMSGSEADFLVRQINSATDVSQLSMFSNMDEYESVAAGLDGGGSVAAGVGLVAGGESIWSTDGFNPPGMGLNQSSYQSHTGLNPNPGSVAGVMSDALKEKISQLERQVNSLNSALARKEAELDKKDVKIKKLNAETDTLRRDNVNELRQLAAEVSHCNICYRHSCSRFLFFI